MYVIITVCMTTEKKASSQSKVPVFGRFSGEWPNNIIIQDQHAPDHKWASKFMLHFSVRTLFDIVFSKCSSIKRINQVPNQIFTRVCMPIASLHVKCTLYVICIHNAKITISTFLTQFFLDISCITLFIKTPAV